MKKLVSLLMVIVIFFFNSDVYAICDKNDINRLKEIAKNVQITYEHNVYGDIDSDSPDAVLFSIYDFVVTGLTDEMYLLNDGNRYDVNDMKDGILNIRTSSGERKIYIFSKNCVNILLDTRVFNLPRFNFNSMNEECQKDEFKDLDICQEFIDDDNEEVISGDFEEKIEEVKKERSVIYRIFDLIRDNLMIVFGICGVIGIMFIILFIRHRKRSVLE